jgi:hypothetical protein
MDLLLGALNGAGKAFNQNAGNHIKQWNDEKLKALQENKSISTEKSSLRK